VIATRTFRIDGHRFAPSLSHEGRNERAWGYLVSGNYFEVLGVQPYLGRYSTGRDRSPGQYPVAVIRLRLLAKSASSDQSFAGRQLSINGHTFTVLGVRRKAFAALRSLMRPNSLCR
jgi:hypothetical protein